MEKEEPELLKQAQRKWKEEQKKEWRRLTRSVMLAFIKAKWKEFQPSEYDSFDEFFLF